MSHLTESVACGVVGAMVVATALLAGCGEGDSATVEAGGDGSTYTPAGVVGRPYVDGSGAAWVPTSGGGLATLAVMRPERETLEVDLDGTVYGESSAVVLHPSPIEDGVLVAWFRCAADGCTDAPPVAVLDRYTIEGESLTHAEQVWAHDIHRDDASASVLLGATSSATDVWFPLQQLVVRVSMDGATEVPLPPTATQPCSINGQLMTLSDPPADSPDIPSAGDSAGLDSPEYPVRIEGFHDGEWRPVTESERTVGSPDGYPAARCSRQGIELGVAGEPVDSRVAAAVWNGAEWEDLVTTDGMDWVLRQQDTYEGLLGVVGVSVVLLDSTTGDTLLGVRLPEPYVEVWEVGEPGEQSEEWMGPPSGAVGIGGPHDRPVAIACPSGPTVEEVVCDLFT